MVDWPSYLADFHARRPGQVEQVLRRSVSGHHDPYRWVSRAVATSATRVLDLACGSAALTSDLAAPGRTVVGVDLSPAELALAVDHGRGRGAQLVRADARRLPFTDASFDAVASMLGMAVVVPTGELLDEVARVLRRGGLLVALVPTGRPLSRKDLRTATSLLGKLQQPPQFPAQIDLRLKALLAQHGLRKVEDARERYRFTVRSRADAELLLDACYFPEVDPERTGAAVDWLARRAERDGSVDVPLPLRRIIALH